MSSTVTPLRIEMKKPLCPGFELRQCNISIEDCRTDNVAYPQFTRGEVPTLEHWKNVLQIAVQSDAKGSDPMGLKKLPTREHIENIVAEKIKPRSIWKGSDPFDVRWRHQVRHYYEVETEKEWEFEGTVYKETRLRYNGQLVTPVEISYNLILAAHAGGGKHLGRIQTYGKLKEVTQSLREHSMVARFIDGCPNPQCKKNKVIAKKKRGYNNTEGVSIEPNNKKAKLSHDELGTKPWKPLDEPRNNVDEFAETSPVVNEIAPDVINSCELDERFFDGVIDYEDNFILDPYSFYWLEYPYPEYPDPPLLNPSSTCWQTFPCYQYPDPEF